MIDILIHDKAQRHYNQKAIEIKKSVTVQTPDLSASNDADEESEEGARSSDSTFDKSTTRFHPHVTSTIRKEDIIGNIIHKQIAESGRIESVQLVTKSNIYSLTNDVACAELTKLIDNIWQKDQISDYVSRDFIIHQFLEWLDVSDTFEYVQFTLKNIKAAVTSSNIIVPLYRFVVSKPIKFQKLDCILRPISNAEIDNHVLNCASEIDIETLRSNFQATCIVECNIVADSSHAITIAIEKANVISDIFAFYSPFALFPDQRFNGVHLGSEYVPSYKALVKSEDMTSHQLCGGVRSTEYGRHYIVGRDDLKAMEESGIKELTNLLCKKKPNEFEKKVRSSASIFLKNAYTSSNTEKIIFAVVALETLMLKNQSEPIVQNVSERTAFLLAHDIDSRKSCIKAVKDAYGIRSAYMHHGRSSEDKETIMDFLIIVFATITHIIENSLSYKTKNDFIKYVDDLRLS